MSFLRTIINELSLQKRNFSDRLNDRHWQFTFHVVDHCNLKCKCCDHYSPIADEWFVSLEEVEDTFSKLGPVISGRIDQLHLLGGEPLLHPRLHEIIPIVRKYLPTDKITVLTNGILLKKISQELIDAIKEYNIVLSLTEYPLKMDYRELEVFLDESGMKHEIFRAGKSFGQMYCSENKEGNWLKNYLHCQYWWTVVHIYRGRVYPCAHSAYLDFLNKRFGTKFEHVKGSYIEIKDVHSIWDLRWKRICPNKICKDCVRNKWRFVPWELSSQKKDEWVL